MESPLIGIPHDRRDDQDEQQRPHDRAPQTRPAPVKHHEPQPHEAVPWAPPDRGDEQDLDDREDQEGGELRQARLTGQGELLEPEEPAGDDRRRGVVDDKSGDATTDPPDAPCARLRKTQSLAGKRGLCGLGHSFSLSDRTGPSGTAFRLFVISSRQDPLGEPVPEELAGLHDHHDDCDRDPGRLGIELLVAVEDGEVPQPSAADVARHRRHVHHGDEHEGVAEDQGGERLGDHHREQHRQAARTDRGRRLDDSRVDGDEVLLDDPPDHDRGHDRHGHDRGVGAESRADDSLRDRRHSGEEDDERDRSDEIDHEVQHLEDERVREEIPRPGGIEDRAEEEPGETADQEGHHDHVDRLLHRLEEDGRQRAPFAGRKKRPDHPTPRPLCAVRSASAVETAPEPSPTEDSPGSTARVRVRSSAA
ncbi:hypothetical protein ABE10_12295, partial [Bacillus toyonensis]|nr:hypothetical protein [Bacillus toyonensis]